MKLTALRTLVVCLVMLLVASQPVKAILGIGDIVFDPSNYEEAIQQLLQMEMQYEQLVKHYLVLKNQYDHMRRMEQQVPVNMGARYRARITPWRSSSASDAYRQGVAASLSQSSLRILDRFLSVLPTVTIREGQRVKIYLADDLLLPAYENHRMPNEI